MPPLPQLAATEVFFPRPDMPYGPEAQGAYDHFFDVEGIRLRLRIFPGPQDAATILFFHGNGETGRDYDFAAGAYRELPCNFMVAEYRGYGPCTGSPSLNTYLDDAHFCLDAAREVLAKRGGNSMIVVMGRSLGSAPAIELAARRPGDVSALIVESGFALTVPLLRLIGIPTEQLGITEEHGPGNLKKIKGVQLPTLIMHAQQDEIIPVGDAELLHEACADPNKTFLRVPGAGHNDIQMRAGDGYFQAIADTLARIPV